MGLKDVLLAGALSTLKLTKSKKDEDLCSDTEEDEALQQIAPKSRNELATSQKQTCIRDQSVPQTTEPGAPLRIAYCPRVQAVGGQLQLNVTPLISILTRPDVEKLPVVVFSINGPVRCGKSFLLTQAVKFLKYGKSNPSNWIDIPLENSFDWRWQWDAVTEGIQIWPEPFILTDDSDVTNTNKIAVILMDNQGLEDEEVDSTSTHKLFCLSNLLSSIFAYCDKKGYTKHFLENLHQYVQFSRTVEYDNGIRNGETPSGQSQFTFGHLILQYRDFRFVQDYPCPDGCQFYSKSSQKRFQTGKCLYSKIFEDSPGVTDDVRRVRNVINKYYDEVTICTMRGPGNAEPNDTDRKESRSWDAEYLKGVKKFIERVFRFEYLEKWTKKIHGHEVTAGELVLHVERWAKATLESKYNILTMTPLESTRNLHYHQKIQHSMELYETLLNKYKKDSERKAFYKFQKEAMQKIEKEYWTKCSFVQWKEPFFELLKERIGNHLRDNRRSIKKTRKERRKKRKNKAKTAGVAGGAATLAGAGTLIFAGGIASIAGAAVIPVGIAAGVGGGSVYWYSRRKEKREKKAIEKCINYRVDREKLLKSGIQLDTLHA